MLTKHIIYPLYDVLSGRRILSTLRDLERDQWKPTGELEAEQLDRLKDLLSRAYQNVPYYKRAFRQHGLSAQSIRSLEDLQRLPVLPKRAIRRHKRELISEAYTPAQLIPNHTGGSTGEALQFYQDQQQWDYGIAARISANRWAGWDLGKRTLRLWGHPRDVALSRRLRGRIRSLLLNDHTFDTFHFSSVDMVGLVDRIRRDPPDFIIGYSSSLYHFARFLEESGLSVPAPDGIISSAETLYPAQRSVIERALDAEVFNRYGCREVDFVAAECPEHRGMHIDIRRLIVEFVNETGAKCRSGERGRILITDLTNHAMPFIRYDIGDVGIPIDGSCPCGRGLPLMEELAGRVVDILQTPDGRFVRPSAMTLVRDIAGVQQLQLVQDQPDHLIVRVVKDIGYSKASESGLRARLSRSFGTEMHLDFDYRDSIPLEPSGKYRFSISRLSDRSESGNP